MTGCGAPNGSLWFSSLESSDVFSIWNSHTKDTRLCISRTTPRRTEPHLETEGGGHYSTSAHDQCSQPVLHVRLELQVQVCHGHSGSVGGSCLPCCRAAPSSVIRILLPCISRKASVPAGCFTSPYLGHFELLRTDPFITPKQDS